MQLVEATRTDEEMPQDFHIQYYVGATNQMKEKLQRGSRSRKGGRVRGGRVRRTGLLWDGSLVLWHSTVGKEREREREEKERS